MFEEKAWRSRFSCLLDGAPVDIEILIEWSKFTKISKATIDLQRIALIIFNFFKFIF